MPADHLEALFARARPGMTREQLAEEAGMALHQLNYLFRPERPERLPKWETVRAIAQMLKVDVNDVVQAMAADHGISLETEPERDEQLLLIEYRALSVRDQGAVRALIRALSEGQ